MLILKNSEFDGDGFHGKSETNISFIEVRQHTFFPFFMSLFPLVMQKLRDLDVD